jgi:hypothetical protein
VAHWKPAAAGLVHGCQFSTGTGGAAVGAAAAGTVELSSTLAVATAMAALAHRVIRCLRRASPRRDKRSLILPLPCFRRPRRPGYHRVPAGNITVRNWRVNTCGGTEA